MLGRLSFYADRTQEVEAQMNVGTQATRSPAILNLPNALTGLRLLLVPFVALALVAGDGDADGRAVALVLFLAASATDVADGQLARRRGQCTAVGAFLDPIADKALVGTALVCLSAVGAVPWWATLLILGRELAVTGLRVAVLRHGVLPASRGGKAKTLTQTVLVVLALAVPHERDLLSAVLVVTLVCALGSGVDYAVRALRLAAGGRGPA